VVNLPLFSMRKINPRSPRASVREAFLIADGFCDLPDACLFPTRVASVE
jgi:hypothetical protein